MNKIALVIGLSILTVLNTNAQWTQINSGTTAKIDAIHFIDSQNGYCSGGFINTLITNDGGNSWTIGSSHGFHDFSFYNSTYGYAISISGQSMAKTINGGSSWTSITPVNSNSLWGVSSTSSTTAYFVGTGGVLWKTTNSGASLTVLNSGTTDLITDIVFVNSTTGFFVAQDGQIRRTTNSGTSWNTVYTLTSILPTEMYFVDEFIGYVVGSKGTVAKTVDGGSNWTLLTTNSTSYLQGVNFFDANYGIVVGTTGTILYTSDGGVTWSSQNSGTTVNLYDVSMLSSTSAIVTGDNGTILKNNSVVTKIESKHNLDLLLYPDPVNEMLFITTPVNVVSIEIYNSTGKLMTTENTINKTNFSIDFTMMPAGIYFVYIKTDESFVVKKVIK
jgi:photosystem II stability/assembly factor-like uncharacterized protein